MKKFIFGIIGITTLFVCACSTPSDQRVSGADNDSISTGLEGNTTNEIIHDSMSSGESNDTILSGNLSDELSDKGEEYKLNSSFRSEGQPEIIKQGLETSDQGPATSNQGPTTSEQGLETSDQGLETILEKYENQEEFNEDSIDILYDIINELKSN